MWTNASVVFGAVIGAGAILAGAWRLAARVWRIATMIADLIDAINEHAATLQQLKPEFEALKTQLAAHLSEHAKTAPPASSQ